VTGSILALSGGVGGAKLCAGLAATLNPESLTIVVNTGDDFEHLGLSICPDLDSVIYALSGLSDPLRGWGRRDESWNFMAALRGLGGPDWFALGDADLAMHVERTHRLRAGAPLSAVIRGMCSNLGIAATVLPMSDAPVRTRVHTDEGWLDFQDYFVRRRCQPTIDALQFAGIDEAAPHAEFVAALRSPDLRAVVICPSNPIVSVDPILALRGVREALARVTAPVIAVTPIVRSAAIKGPAAKMLRELGLPCTCQSVAERYADFLDVFVHDASETVAPHVPGIRMLAAQTLMHGADDRVALARTVLAAAGALDLAP
jgi:LPPG:FO 2-phospho-L-lactate transferase